MLPKLSAYGTVACLLLSTVSLRADDYAELFREAATYAQQAKYEQAIAKYRAALAIRPGAPEALNNLAVMYYEMHEYSAAFDTASRIWKSHPELKSAALITGLAAIQTQRPKEALAPLERVISSDATNRDALLGLASAQLALGDLMHAAAIYERETGYAPNDSTAWYGEAICYEKLAEEASRRLARTPGGAEYSKRLLGEYLQSAGDERLAREAFGEAQGLHAGASPEASKQYEVARKLAEKSRGAFERLVNVAPDSWQTAVFLGDVDRQHGNLVAALEHYKKAADAEPKNAAPLLGMGTTYWEMGDFDRATSCLHETLKINPQAQQAVFELGNIAVRRHQESEAIPLLTRYLAAQPDALAAHADLGRAYFHLKQYQEAGGELEKAAAADERGDINYQLSVSLRKLGRTHQADLALAKSNAIREAQLERARKLQTEH